MEQINVEKSQSLSAPLRAQIFFSIPKAPFGRYGLVSDVLRWRSGLKKALCNLCNYHFMFTDYGRISHRIPSNALSDHTSLSILHIASDHTFPKTLSQYNMNLNTSS